MHRRFELAVSPPEEQGDRPVQVADRQIRTAIAIEVGAGDPLGPFDPVRRTHFRIAEIQAGRKGLQIGEQLPPGWSQNE